MRLPLLCLFTLACADADVDKPVDDSTPAPTPTPSEIVDTDIPDTDDLVDTDSTEDTDVVDTDVEDTDPPAPLQCDDSAEDNDTAGTAVPIVTATPLQVDDTDADYFSIDVPPYTILTVNVRFAHADGDIDVELTMRGQTSVGGSGNDNERVELYNDSDRSRTATLYVYAYDTGVCIPYELRMTQVEDLPCTTPAGAKRVFLTSQEYEGDMTAPTAAPNGLRGADEICGLHASMAGLGGQWRAWLSDANTDAIDRIPDVGPWYLPGQCDPLFDSKASITFAGPESAFNVDEDGQVIHQAQASFWSGTTRFGRSNGFHCDNWTSDSFIGLEGGRGSPYFDWDHQSYWTDFVTGPCNQAHSLLCLER